jgi:hypothetical protein
MAWAQGVHLAGMAGEVHGHDGAGPGSDAGLELLHVHVQGGRLNIDEDGRGAHVDDDVCGGGERDGRGDHLIAGSHAKRD